MLDLIDNSITKLTKPTRLDLALQQADEEMFTDENGDRPGVRSVMMLFTDGRSHPKKTAVEKYISTTFNLKVRQLVTIRRIIITLLYKDNSKPSEYNDHTQGAFFWEYSGIRIYSGIYSGYSAPGSRIAGMEIQVFRNRKSSQTNANLHYSNYSYSGLIPNERALSTHLRLVETCGSHENLFGIC